MGESRRGRKRKGRSTGILHVSAYFSNICSSQDQIKWKQETRTQGGHGQRRNKQTNKQTDILPQGDIPNLFKV